MGERRGRGALTSKSNREKIKKLVEEARAKGARLNKIFEIIGISLRTYQRWQHIEEDKRSCIKKEAKNKLTIEEELKIIETINMKKYRNLAPAQIVPKLADEGKYIGSESTFYRVMKKYEQQKHRRRSKEPKKRVMETHEADGPNQVWTWDITWLKSNIKGKYYKLYLIVDIYSRMIIDYEIWEEESSEKAILLIEKAVMKQKMVGKPLVLHSDNGGPMKGATFQATLERLGLTKSYSRPRVSNDNAYSESLFKTLKYVPEYPRQGFETLDDARGWVYEFKKWYNTKHMHSGIEYITPKSRHEGKGKKILDKRKEVYKAAKARNPERWSRGIRNWKYTEKVVLNPLTEKIENKETA